jgi:UDP-glucuronate 4-epimerase
MTFIESIEKAAGKIADKNFLPMQAGDVPATYADVTSLENAAGFKPTTDLTTGIQYFIDWYKEYYSN